MVERVFTVEDILRMIQIVKKETQYLETLREKWEAQKRRFPLIYEGIVKQQEALKLRVAKLRQMKVVVQVADIEDLPTQIMEEAKAEVPKPAVSHEPEAAPEKSTQKEETAAPAAKETPTKVANKSAATAKTVAKPKSTKPTPKRRLGIKA